MSRVTAMLVLASLSLFGTGAGDAWAWDPLQKARRAAQEAGEHLAAGETGEAVDAYARAQALNPDAPEYRMGLGEALFADGDLEGALGQFLAAADPEQPGLARRALYNAGNSALAAGEVEKALTLYERAVLVDEPDPDLLHNLELAQRLLEQQQQQDSQEQQESQDQQDDQEQEQEDPQQQQEDPQQQDREDQQQQEPQEEDSDQEESPSPPDSLQVPPPPPDSTQVASPDSLLPPPEGMTPEEAMRLLEALDHDEEELRRSIQRRLRGAETESENDW
jgi:tetratricopeptide (TPR) repeat protein